MVPSLLTAANWPIVGQLCWILGKVMNFIYNFLDNCLPSDNGLVGLSIILYTIFVYNVWKSYIFLVFSPLHTHFYYVDNWD